MLAYPVCLYVYTTISMVKCLALRYQIKLRSLTQDKHSSLIVRTISDKEKKAV